MLDGSELLQLKSLIQSAIQESNLEPRAFATKNGICLGLESSLRKINNQSSCCVFISLNIKPNYVISLIARNAQVKDETQPVFAQPKLEDFIQEIFGIQALCMVFTKNLLEVNEQLNSWVSQRRKPEKSKITSVYDNTNRKKNLKKRKMVKVSELEENIKTTDHIKSEKETKLENNTKPWSSDFISFGENHETKPKLDGNAAIDALTKIIDNFPKRTKNIAEDEVKTEAMEVDAVAQLPTLKTKTDDTDSDDFLPEYKTLIVHKIKANPNKHPKKKRKKNKKKNEISK